MIELREGYDTSDMTLNKFTKALEDIYYNYFPKGKFWKTWKCTSNPSKIQVKYEFSCSTKVLDPLSCNALHIWVFSNDGFKTIEPSVDIITSFKEEGFVVRKSNSSLFCTGMGFSNAERLTLEEVLEWFDNSCSRLYKITRKALRRGEIDEKWGEYIV